MRWIVMVLIMVIAVLLVICYALMVMAHDADALMKQLQDFCDWCKDGRKQGADFCLDCMIPNAPTIETKQADDLTSRIIDAYKALPSAQPKRGEWISCKGSETCDQCGFTQLKHRVNNYCPNCGARMTERSE